MDNWKALLFLLAFGQGIMLSIALIVRGILGYRANFFLGLILFTLSLELLNAWGIQVRYHQSANPFPFWNLQSYPLIPICLYFFAQLTTKPGYNFKKKYWLVFLPSVIEVMIRFAWQFYRRHTGQDLPSLLENPVWFFTTEILPIIGMFAALGIYARNLLGFQAAWKKQSDGFRPLHYVRLYGLFSFMVVLTLLWAAGVMLDWPVFGGVEILLTICLFGAGYIGYLNPSFFMLPDLKTAKVPERPEFSHYNDPAELQKLNALFLKEHLHRQSRLTLEEVAAKLRLPLRYVSYLINTHCNTNFNSFVNRFRVDEVISKLADPKEQHKTLLALALEAGFNSKSTFNQVFRQHTGKSPSQYLLVQK
jgi:AraC-like DNA-binding protein